MDFDDIVLKAMDKTINVVVTKSTQQSEFPKLSDELQSDVDIYRPIFNYVNALVAESLRIYHEQVQDFVHQETADKQS